jgi:hypothetical protein
MIGNTISNNYFGAGSEESGISDFNSVGFSGGDVTSLGYTDRGFNGVPPGQGSPIPEPSTLAMFGFGLASILGIAARQRQKSARSCR